jgi:hypothetical protein
MQWLIANLFLVLLWGFLVCFGNITMVTHLILTGHNVRFRFSIGI